MFEFVLEKLFRFFSSLKLAVILILSLAAALAAGTIQESLHDAKAAREAVYHTWWFACLLMLLAVNVAGAAFSRWPWKRRHTGFVITHAGIILILAGSLMTLALGKNGQMAVRIDQSSNVVLLENQILVFQVPGKGIDAVFPVKAAPLKKSKVLSLAPWSPVSAKINQVIPAAKAETKISDKNSGAPGVLLRLSGMMGEMNEWMVLGDSMRERIKLGPAEVLLLRASNERELDFLMNESNQDALKGELIIMSDDKEYRMNLPLSRDSAISIPGLKQKIRAINSFKDATIKNRKLEEKSSEPNNPALTFEVIQGNKREVHSVFSRFPELPSFHGEDSERQFNLSFFYKPSYLPVSDRNSLWIIIGPEGHLYYRVKSKGEFAHKGPLFKSKDFRTGWMDFVFSVEDYRPNIVIEREYTKLPKTEIREDAPSAIQVNLMRKNESRLVWLELGEKKTVFLDNDISVRLSYILDREILPFALKLLKFNVGRYEGSANPMSYESLVEVSDFNKSRSFKHTIKMNHPLKYGGLTFYQAAFQEEAGVPSASVFAVGKDPGIPVKYLGSIILVLGIGIQFFARKWLYGESKKSATRTLTSEKIFRQQVSPENIMEESETVLK